MSARKDSHSVFNEPNEQPGNSRRDPSEDKAQRALEREAARRRRGDGGGQSVYDEPDILPGRENEAIEQDWTCSACGYNLRGLPAGHRCPECGRIELYRPPPPDAASYASRFEQESARVSIVVGWGIASALALLGGVFGVVGSFFEFVRAASPMEALTLVICGGPVVEEVIKIFPAAMLVERRPWLFRRVEQIQLATLGAALVFAAVINIIFLAPAAKVSVGLVIWRWTVCIGVQVGCTAIATRGLIAVWQRSVTERRPPRITDSVPMLILAIIIHALYEAGMASYDLAGRPLGWW